jgi:hypothetical protein
LPDCLGKCLDRRPLANDMTGVANVGDDQVRPCEGKPA